MNGNALGAQQQYGSSSFRQVRRARTKRRTATGWEESMFCAAGMRDGALDERAFADEACHERVRWTVVEISRGSDLNDSAPVHERDSIREC